MKIDNFWKFSFLLLPFTMFFEFRPSIKILHTELHIDWFELFFLLFAFFSIFKRKVRIFSIFKGINLIALLFYLVVIFQFLRGPKSSFAIEELFKLTVGIFIFLYGRLYLQYYDFDYLTEKTSKLSFLIAFFLSCIYLIKFHHPFWSGNILVPSGESKNVVGFIMTTFFPFFFFSHIEKKSFVNLFWIILFVILIILNLSRETWVSLGVGLLLTIVVTNIMLLSKKFHSIFRSLKKINFYLFSIIIVITVTVVILYQNVPFFKDEANLIKLKFLSIILMKEVPGYHSIEVRKFYYLTGIKKFSENPLGYGWGEIFNILRMVPHNNFIWLAVDVGIIGLLLYLFFIKKIFVILLEKIKKEVMKGNTYSLSYLYSFLSVHIQLFFVDNLTLPQIWMMYILWTKYGESLEIIKIKGHNAI